MPIAFGFQYAGPRVRACIGMVRSPKATLSYHMRADELPVAGRLSTSSDPGAHDILVVWMPRWRQWVAAQLTPLSRMALVPSTPSGSAPSACRVIPARGRGAVALKP